MLMMTFNGLGGAGLGDVWSTCARVATSVDGTQLECIDDSGAVIAAQPVGGSVPPSTTPPGSSTQTSWWESALTALTKGVVGGVTNPTTGATIIPCVSPGVPVGCNYTAPVVEQPWYMTPVGIGGIVLAGVLGYFILKK